MGLAHAGFDVVGIDHIRRRRYPFPFVVADVLDECVDLTKADLIWASPPCQASSLGGSRWARGYPQLIPATRAILERSGRPFVIENVPRAPIRADLVLTGPMFGLKTYRRRHFEIRGFPVPQPPVHRAIGPRRDPSFVTVAGHGGHGLHTLAAFRSALGIDWMQKSELVEAVPPVYSEFIGRAALHHFNP